MFMIADLSQTSPAAPGTVVGLTVGPNPALDPRNYDLSRYDRLEIETVLQGATGGTLDVYLQFWDGSDWVDYIHYTQIAGGAGAVRLAYVPQVPTTHTVVTVGANTTPALAAGSSVGNHPGERLRVLFVAGAGTSAGATQTIRVMGTSSWSH